MNSSSFASYRAAQNVEDQDYDPDYDWYENGSPVWEGDCDEIEQKYQEDMWLQEQEDERLHGDYYLDFESDNEPDWYAYGYDAFRSGYSQIPPSSIFEFGHSAVTLWNNGYRQSVEDRMGNIGVRKNGRKY